jgi:hypothetical protein
MPFSPPFGLEQERLKKEERAQREQEEREAEIRADEQRLAEIEAKNKEQQDHVKDTPLDTKLHLQEPSDHPAHSSGDDIFNIARDDKCHVPSGDLATGGEVRHSDPAIKLLLAPFRYTNIDLRFLHKVPFRFWDESMSVEPLPAAPPRRSQSRSRLATIRELKDLTATEGHFILVENTEEELPVVANIGMGSRITHYYGKINAEDTTCPVFDDGPTVCQETKVFFFFSFGFGFLFLFNNNENKLTNKLKFCLLPRTLCLLWEW